MTALARRPWVPAQCEDFVQDLARTTSGQGSDAVLAAIEGGIAQGIGMALMEEYIPGRTENLHDYLIPTIGDVPPVEHILVEVPDPEGPHTTNTSPLPNSNETSRSAWKPPKWKLTSFASKNVIRSPWMERCLALQRVRRCWRDPLGKVKKITRQVRAPARPQDIVEDAPHRRHATPGSRAFPCRFPAHRPKCRAARPASCVPRRRRCSSRGNPSSRPRRRPSRRAAPRACRSP